MIILGSGMAGCIAGIVYGDVRILEGNLKPEVKHKAVLRFKTNAVSEAVGIPFRKVMVHKAIWLDGCEIAPSIRMNHMYSEKVSGHYMLRSIANTDSEIRYIAPVDFHEQMLSILNKKISYTSKVKGVFEHSVECYVSPSYSREHNEPIISTLPIMVNAKITKSKVPEGNFNSHSIFITQFKIYSCDTFATIYFPGPKIPVYRASVTGDLMIIESMKPVDTNNVNAVFNAFGMDGCENHSIITNEVQQGGKIVPMPEKQRREFLYNLTVNHNIYSLGRFATWRNILLDDVLHDISVIKTMINLDKYDRMKGV